MSGPAAEYMSKIGRGEAKNEGGSQLGATAFPNWLCASDRTQRNDVGSGGQSGGNLGGGAGGNDHVVIFTSSKTAEHRGRLLRVDQRQVSQEGEDVLGWLQSRRHEGDFDIFMAEVPSQRSRQTHRSLIRCGLQDSGGGVVKHDAELAFIFAAELAQFERAGAGRGFPIHMAGGVVRHVLADEIEIVAAAAHKSFELAGDHGKNFAKLFGGLDHGIDDHFAGQVNAPGFHQEGEGKARGQAEVFYAVAAAGGEGDFQVGAEFLSGSKKGKVNGFLQNRLFYLLAHAQQAAVGQAEPLVLGRAVAGPPKGRGFPLPAGFGIIFALGGNHAHGKGGQPRAGIAQEQTRQHRTPGKNVLGQVDIERETTEHQRGGDAGNQNGRKQRGDDNVQQIVAGVEGGDSDQDADQNVDQAGACDVVVHGFADAAGDHPPSQVGDGGQADEGGKQ